MTAVAITRPSSGRLEADIRLPGSKSLTNRALALAALTGCALTLTGASDSEDSAVMLTFLRQLGWAVEVSDTSWRLTPPDESPDPARVITVDLKQAGTAARFLTAVCTRLPGTFVLDGTPRLRERPLGPLVLALRADGARIQSLQEPGRLPLQIHGDSEPRQVHFTVSADLSSQLASALLLLAPTLTSGSRVTLAGALASEPYVKMTIGICREFGATWSPNERSAQREWTLLHDGNPPADYAIEGDWSAASYWLGLAATLPSRLSLRDLNPASLQGDAEQLKTFLRWGLEFRFDQRVMHVSNGQGNLVRPFAIDFTSMPDLAQTFAVLALFGDSASSELTGLDTLPRKETDRLAALVTDLSGCGGEAQTTQSPKQGLGLRVAPVSVPPVLPRIETYDDHRMAMAFALLANRHERVVIQDPQVVRKSYPGFWDDLARAGYRLEWL